MAENVRKKYGMKATSFFKTKERKCNMLYDTENLMKHPSMQEAKILILKIGVSEQSFSTFLKNTSRWNKMEKLRKSNEEFDQSVKRIQKTARTLRKSIAKNIPTELIPKAKEISAVSKNNPIKKYKSGIGDVEKVLWDKSPKDKDYNASVLDVLSAIELFFKDINHKKFDALNTLREIEPDYSTISSKSLLARWIYINLLKIDVIQEIISGGDRIDNKNKIIALIASVLYGTDFKSNDISGYLENIRDKNDVYRESEDNPVITKIRKLHPKV